MGFAVGPCAGYGMLPKGTTFGELLGAPLGFLDFLFFYFLVFAVGPAY